MELAQNIDTTFPNSETVSTAFGITPTMIFWSILAVVVIALLIWAAARYADRNNRYGSGGAYQGTKGGKVKRTITEYVDETDRV